MAQWEPDDVPMKRVDALHLVLHARQRCEQLLAQNAVTAVDVPVLNLMMLGYSQGLRDMMEALKRKEKSDGSPESVQRP